MPKLNKLLLIVLFANLAGAAYGFFSFYSQQFLSFSPLLWIFIPDCPLYALFFAIIALMLLFHKRNNLFFFVSFVGALKYGFWTLFVLLYFNSFYFSPSSSLMYSVLFIAHMGLMLECILLLGRTQVKFSFLLVSLFWFLLNDFADYFLAAHPVLPPNSLNFMFYATIAMTFAFTFIAFIALKKAKKPMIDV